MRNLIHMTLLFVLSLPIFASEMSLSTLKKTVMIGQSLSSSTYEKVMDNLVDVQAICENEPSRKAENLALILGKSKDKRKALTERELSNLKAQVMNTPITVVQYLQSQVDRLNGMKNLYQSYDTCGLERLALIVPGISEVIGTHTVQNQIDFSISYLEDIIAKVKLAQGINETKVIEGEERDFPKITKVTEQEKEIYQYCSSQLAAVIKEFGYEKK